MTLSILIPTLPERHEYLKRLQNILLPQVEKYKDRIQIIYHDAGRSMSIGQKRNELKAMVATEYFDFIDDDDLVHKHYAKWIMDAIALNPDVVTFNGWMTTNGGSRENFVIKLGERYEKRDGVYYRFPNHLCPMKTSLVRHINFPNIVIAEDYQWANQINYLGLLKSSVHITEDIYYYDFQTRKPAYGSR